MGMLPPTGSATGSGGLQAKLPPGTAWSPQRFAVWSGALLVLWFILSALADSGNADIARGIAGLLVFGALVVLGPGAIQNAQMLFGGSSSGS